MVRKRNHREPVPAEPSRRVRRYLRLVKRFPWAVPGVVVLVGIGIGVHHFIYSSPFFEISEIELSGLDRTTSEKLLHSIEEYAWVMEGTSLFLVDVNLVQEAVERLVTIESATVTREWPNRLVIDISEKQPAGILVSESGSHVFTREGSLFAETTVRDFYDTKLTILTGASVTHDEAGMRIDSAPFITYREFVEVFRRANSELLDTVAEFQWHDDRGLTLQLSSGSLYHCGFRSPREVGPLVETLVKQHEGKNAAPIEVNLFSDHSIAIVERDLPETVSAKRQLALSTTWRHGDIQP
ncbi:MAG: FtsQ-type POTRA domain-containing protein [Candidatus Sumerlaeia bacterium]|nr:FtsQ-type POTRA domain-containing protein [Candidatus Sumerlaeia bacterium]